VGPFIDGLFTQSNFGVVTRMGVWLMPKPEDFCAFFLFADDERALEDLVPRLAALRMQGIVQSTVHIANDLRVISGKAAYPWERTGGKTPLPDDVRAALRSEYAIGAWNVAGALYGSRETVAAARKTIRRALPNYRVAFLDDRRLAAAERLHRLLSKVGLGHALGEKLESVRPVFGLLKGVPTDEPMRGASWRVRGPAPAQPADPLDRNAGLLWIAPVLPATAADARAVVTLVDPIYRKHGFETLVTFTLITERAMVCVTNVSFDRRDADETARARACYDELSHRLMDEGYVPYRSGPAGMAALDPHADTFWDVTSRIKHALDPDGIIAPGRYDPRAA
jgi:4-cresol dehydrogenase (hydroxylating)